MKIAFGAAYGFLFWKFYHGDDTWQYHNFSLVEYQNLLHHPFDFLRDIRTKANGNTSLQSMYDTTNSFWNKFDDVLFVKLLTVFNLFSFGHYYVNVVLFCFLVYLGNLLLFRLMIRYYPDAGKLLTLAIFYNPMIVFWLSGIRKEGIIFLALVVTLFYFDRLMRREGKTSLNIIFVVVGLAVGIVMRNFVVMCLLPSLLGWLISSRFRIKPVVSFLAMYVLCIVVFFMSTRIPGLPNLPAKVAQRQHDYFKLVANTRLALDSLNGTAASFLRVLPQALNHSFLRPYIAESKGPLQLLSSIDVLVLYVAVVIAIVYRRRDWRSNFQNPVLLTFLLTSFFAYLLIGYTVPFPGTFIRYKSIFELLLICVMVTFINFYPQKQAVISKK